ncbi:MAG: glutamine-hydrolyzing carbamoyl-phosphate synthase small subunit [Myxococcota bacterium]
MNDARIVLADGTEFAGRSVGASGRTTGEAVFTTGMTGYQEVLTDPSYCRQVVTMTAPQIGNTGTNSEDLESARPHVSAFVMRELSPIVSNWRSTLSLPNYLKEHGIVALEGVDTRALTRHIRDHGAQMAAIGVGDYDEMLAEAKGAEPMEGSDLTHVVTSESTTAWEEGSGSWRDETFDGAEGTPFHVVAYDFGVKHNILRCLVDAGFRVTRVPARTSANDALKLAPDGVFLSNGPGDPGATDYAVDTIQGLLGKLPIFGICLGHQLLCRALGATTYKLKFGHRGLNQPVKDLASGRIEITTQNHGFVVDGASLGDGARVTHEHLNDGTCMGVEAPAKKAFSVQYHPEAGAGPHDSRGLFHRFGQAMAAHRAEQS